MAPEVKNPVVVVRLRKNIRTKASAIKNENPIASLTLSSPTEPPKPAAPIVRVASKAIMKVLMRLLILLADFMLLDIF
jgi:hypothetical protein